MPAARFNFASSGALQRQIELGAPVDVFVSAGVRQMDSLENGGFLLEGTRRELLANQLVLVVPAGSPHRSLSFAELGGDGIRRIAIGDRSVPAGDYTRQSLAHFRLRDAVRAKLVPLGSVRAVAQAVAAGDVDAGFIYRSDARNRSDLRIVAIAPENSHAPILYSVAVVRSSRQPARARAYISALSSAPASQVFNSYGLRPLTTQAPAAAAASR